MPLLNPKMEKKINNLTGSGMLHCVQHDIAECSKNSQACHSDPENREKNLKIELMLKSTRII